jgi:predicted RNA-binding protein YlxR (DUF448 family)
MADPAQTPSRGNWVCPCSGCKKARKQAFDEILEILDQEPYDILHNVHLLREKIRDEYPTKPIKK